MSNSLIGYILVLPLALLQTGLAQAPAATAHRVFPLYLKVELDKSVKLSSFKPGDVAEGNLARDVYSGDRKVFPAGSHVRLTVDHLERKRTTPSDRWPWVIRFFAPRHETFPSFKGASVLMPDGSESLLQVSLISASRRTEVHAEPAKRRKSNDEALSAASAVPATDLETHSAGGRSRPSPGTIMSLEAGDDGNEPVAGDRDPAFACPVKPVTLPSGTALRILLLNRVSAGKSHPGDGIQARLLEPVVLDSQVRLPAGTLFEGSVVKAVPPSMLSRAGSLSLTFTSLTLLDGSRLSVSASVTAVEVNRGSRTKIDAEGRLHGDRPGVAWMLINGGVTAGIAKEVDDGTQLVMEAILSGATDASTAGTARIAGTIVSGIFMLTRHGRDVILPNLTEMNITLNRPLTLSSPVAATTPNP